MTAGRRYPGVSKRLRPPKGCGPAARALRLVVVDPQPAAQDAVRGLLAGTSAECVGEAATGRKALELVRALGPDAVLLEPLLPDMDGLELVRTLKRVYPKMAVVIRTGVESPELGFQAALSGADAYFSKGASGGALAAFLARLGDGVPPERMPPEPSSPQGKQLPEGLALSQRELDILRCLALGLRTSQMSDTLRLKPETVRTHVKNIFRKIGVRSRTQALLWALRKGLVKANGTGH
jgi:DNA-binding NarL/FixJ family response regulator